MQTRVDVSTDCGLRGWCSEASESGGGGVQAPGLIWVQAQDWWSEMRQGNQFSRRYLTRVFSSGSAGMSSHKLIQRSSQVWEVGLDYKGALIAGRWVAGVQTGAPATTPTTGFQKTWCKSTKMHWTGVETTDHEKTYHKHNISLLIEFVPIRSKVFNV